MQSSLRAGNGAYIVNDLALDISVVICAYTEDRFKELIAAVSSVQWQKHPPQEIIIVIDRNSTLLERTRRKFPDLLVVANQQQPGLSGARNTGIRVAKGEVIAFLDDDAVAAPDWLTRLAQGYTDPKVLGVGGAIAPMWLGGRPRWFPEEFDWVVGCTFRGMPQQVARVRNLIGCNMSFRRNVLELMGGFKIGRVGTLSVGQENDETELCIRLGQVCRDSALLYDPHAQVLHRVSVPRARWKYFRLRCYSEGLSKARMSKSVGTRDGLASERVYTLETLPRGMVRGIGDVFFYRDWTGFARAGAIIMGLTITASGFMIGTMASRLRSVRVPEPSSFDIKSNV